ncbi:MAG: hypothetical protein JNM93_06320 [Bacteriovoracaceae bacterium]|nr:hypothetical protein [Bacteriovoracaceae bacterium]
MKLITGVLACLFCLTAFAQDVTAFKNRYKLIREKETGKLLAIQDQHLLSAFSVTPFLTQLYNDLLEEQRLLRSKSGHRQHEIELFVQGLGLEHNKNFHDDEIDFIIEESLKNLESVDLKTIFKKIEDSQIVKTLESKMQEALIQLSLNTVAHADDAKFFYRRAVTYEVVRIVLDLAKKQFSEIPVLNFASYIVVRVEQLIREQRTFSQNMLMYYLDTFDEKELGMSAEEVDRTFSSIFESRIAISARAESTYAQENWLKYGLDKFYAQMRAANQKLRLEGGRYEKNTERVAYSFVRVTEQGKRKIVNLLDNWNMFSSKPAAAIYLDEPQKILRERRLLNLSLAAINFLPISDSIKNIAEQVISSFYIGQKQTEGALAGYFEANGNKDLAKILYLQNMNPFIFMP